MMVLPMLDLQKGFMGVSEGSHLKKLKTTWRQSLEL